MMMMKSQRWKALRERPWKVATFLGGFLLAVVAVAVDDPGTLPDDEVAQKVNDAILNPQPPLGGPGSHGAAEESPVALGSLHPKYTHTDISLKGAVGTLSLSHMSTGAVSSLTKYGIPGGRPAPFGFVEGFGSQPKPRMTWVHNLHSFVVQREEQKLPCPVGEDCPTSFFWDVYGGPAGAVKTFDFCEPSAPQTNCFASNGSEQDIRLQSLGGALVVHAPEGRYVYLLQDPNEIPGPNNVWLLRYIEPRQYDEATCPPDYFEDAGSDFAGSCHRRIARLFYEVPSECAQGTPGEISQTLGATSQLLRSAVASNGARIVFRYQRLPSRTPDQVHKSHECVLSSVDLVRRDGTVEPSTVTYQYEQVADGDGGTRVVAGRLAGAEWPDQSGGPVTGTKLEYSYQYANDAGVWSVKKDGVQIVRQVLGQRGIVVEDSDGQGNLSARDRYVVEAEANGCAPGVFSAETGACRQQDQFFRTAGRTRGDGSGQLASKVESRFTVTLSGYDPVGDQGPVVTGVSTSAQCSGSPCLAVGADAVNSGWVLQGLEILSTRTVEAASRVRHPNGAYTVYAQELPADTSLRTKPFLPAAELRRVYEGAQAADGGSALLTQDYSYLYGGAGRPASERAYEQLVETSSSSSTFIEEDVNNRVVTRRQYDPVTNRLTGVVRSGYTIKYSAQTTGWAIEARSVGTFYLTRNVCAGQPADDVMGRVRAVVGPCEVSGSLATECAAGPTVPITVYDYWDASNVDDRAGRLKSKSVFPDGCGSTPVVTSYDRYDARGRLLQVTDPNGVVTRYEYEGEKLARKVAAAGDPQFQSITEYGYDDNATHGDYVKPAALPYEVLCYRKNTTPGQGCRGGQLTTLLQWKAKSTLPSGATHTERVDYSYHLGKLRSETFRDAANNIRRTRYYEGDPLDRQTFEAWGAFAPSASSEQRYTQTSLFDAQGNRVGLGLPYQPAASDPDPLCGGFDPNTLVAGQQPQPLSPRCKAFSYDRLNRLSGLLESVDGSSQTGAAAKMCMSYDVAGNLRSVRQGCPRDAGATGDCSQCTQPLLEYRHDDFGNVVLVEAPWGSGPEESGTGIARRGRFQYEYDAAGNLVRKQTPAMAAASIPQWVENTYDRMNRLVKAEAVKVEGGTTSRETLFSYFYDQTVTPPWNCPGYAASKPAGAMGRVQVLTDSFGDHWYRYDANGNVIAIYRSRARPNISPRSEPCYDSSFWTNPMSARYYDSAGRLLNEMHPGGRLFSYNYHSGGTGLEDKISSVDVVLFNGSSWSQLLRIVEDVQWEPFGGLRSYVLVAPKAPAGEQKARVEFHSTGANQPLTSCNSTTFTSGMDTTGRIFGLTVSKMESSGALGDIFKRVYTWKGDQIIQEDTCLMETGDVPPATVRYADAVTGAPGYDARLQLLQAHKVTNSSANKGGSFESRSYQYDLRGNRTLDVQDGWRFKGEYLSGGSRVDLLTARILEGAQCGGTLCTPRFPLTQRYAYDADGRVSRIATYKSPSDSISSPFHALTLDATTDGAHAAVGSVYRQVTDSDGRSYEYFYDAEGRRRLKRYWLSTGENILEDEYFYDGTKLINDWGHTSFDPTTAESVRDEYIWLGDKPIAFFKVRVTRAGQRIEDFVGDCPRNGESAPCGLYFLVADNLGKPVLAFDSYRRVTGVADYDPYGHVNRKTLIADAPVLSAGQNGLMATARVPSSGALVSQVRARFSMLDVQGGSGVFLADTSGTILTGVNSQSTLISNVTGVGALSPWVTPSSTGEMQVRFQAATTTGAMQDAALGAVEYRRFQVGASPVWTPLRYPGQYHDEETDLFENRNRFYEPSTGRFLGSELMMREPQWVVDQASQGRSVPIYAYAYNNPIMFTDPTGNVGVGASFGAGFAGALEFLYETLNVQAAAQGSLQLMAFFDDDGAEASEHGMSKTVGSVMSTDAVGGDAASVSGSPEQGAPIVAGLSAGFFGGVVVTTADNMQEFAGVSDTYNLDIGAVSISLSVSSSATTLVIAGNSGKGYGASVYKMNTVPIYTHGSIFK
ncbi:hypothetical protein LZ198_29750 [Myxococcus sp. K15C18031901]|uniref:RHS repeat-associated core domain-containing protein n=1 Tax=Myxococcus dinghuensis TaxID=2906761 RepID=UPI0020A78F87|nr:RHS repeat-associated core domain-containing protein [Myxococcus dinghuensis]MCP3103071.1 hypothetical protein [Myxococcus dinghuensis]